MFVVFFLVFVCYCCLSVCMFFFFFFNDTATTEIYTLSLHDALPITPSAPSSQPPSGTESRWLPMRSEEHTSELQSRQYLVCRLLLEKKKKHIKITLIKKKRTKKYVKTNKKPKK